jgi:restriction system protein
MIPDYQTLMLPLLKYVDSGKEHRIGEVIEPLAKQLCLTAAEVAEMLPSGKGLSSATECSGQKFIWCNPNYLKSLAAVTSG